MAADQRPDTDATTGKESATPPLQNLANIQGQGRIVSQTLSFAGIPTYDLAIRVGMRELEARSTPLWQISQEFKRKARLVEVEWMQDMDKRGFDGKKLFETAKALIEKHGKKA